MLIQITQTRNQAPIQNPGRGNPGGRHPGGGYPGNRNHVAVNPGGGNPGGNPGGGNPGGNPGGGNPGGNPQPVPHVPNHRQVLFVDDPFKGNINPGTSEGAKLYMKATATMDDDDKFDITIVNAQKFLDHITRDTNTFGWGMLVHTIQVRNNEFKNILVDHKDITESDIKRQAHKTWGNHRATFQDVVPEGYALQHITQGQNPDHVDTFYCRVHSRMIVKRIIGYLKTVDYEVLKNKAKLFTWKGHGDEEVDGPTILWILLQICNPSTMVGVVELKDDLRKAMSLKFQHNVKQLTDYMSSKFRNIQEKGQTHEDYILDLFNALAKVPNSDFAVHVCDERRTWELGADKSSEEFIAKVVTIYNNAVSAARWEEKNPKDAKILALTTKVDELLEQQQKWVALATWQKQGNQNRSYGAQTHDKIQAIADWRMKKNSESLEKEGKTWYWCPKHVVPDKYVGLYVEHKPEDHEEWKKRREAWRSRTPDSKKGADNDKKESESKKLVLSYTLKAALITRCDLTGAQADALLKEVQDELDF